MQEVLNRTRVHGGGDKHSMFLFDITLTPQFINIHRMCDLVTMSPVCLRLQARSQDFQGVGAYLGENGPWREWTFWGKGGPCYHDDRVVCTWADPVWPFTDKLTINK